MSDRKTIQINKAFLSIGKETRKKPIKPPKKPKQKTLHSANKLRKEFVKKMQDFQKKKSSTEDTVVVAATNEFDDEFSKSLGFLQKMIDTKKKTKPKDVIDISLETFEPIQLNPPGTVHAIDKVIIAPDIIQSTNKIVLDILETEPPTSHPIKPIISLPQPQYSCLKNSSKPTYRQLMKTLKHASTPKTSSITIDNLPLVEETERFKKLQAIKKEHALPIRMIKSKRVTTTIKRTLGRKTNSVAILIKNSDTRRTVAAERTLLNSKGIHEIKQYLQQKNLLKAGSSCPNDVLRKMYEQCILTGDIVNKNSDVVVHNFLTV